MDGEAITLILFAFTLKKCFSRTRNPCCTPWKCSDTLFFYSNSRDTDEFLIAGGAINSILVVTASHILSPVPLSQPLRVGHVWAPWILSSLRAKETDSGVVSPKLTFELSGRENSNMVYFGSWSSISVTFFFYVATKIEIVSSLLPSLQNYFLLCIVVPNRLYSTGKAVWKILRVS